LLVPTTATLAVVSMTSHSSAGSASGATLALDADLVSSTGQLDGAAADNAELSGLKSSDTQALSRDVSDRAARSSERTKVNALAAENDKRAAAEAALVATDTIIEVDPAATGAGTSGDASVPAPTTGSHAWVKPINSYVMTSGFAWRWGAFHKGQDLATPVGTPVKAMSSGVILFAGWQPSYGNKVEIKYWDGTVSFYAHNSVVKVKKGDIVAPGQVVSLSGNTGHSTGPHLHVEIRPGGGDPINPVPWFRSHGMPL